MTDIQMIARELRSFGHVLENASMKDFTTFRTGGTADVLVFPKTIEDAASIVKYALKTGVPLTVIGWGSNLVVGDKGIRGIVLRMAENDVVKGVVEQKGDGCLYADAIVKKRDLMNAATALSYTGCGFMAGIPGCVGGGILMNAGTFMGTFIDILESVRYVTKTGEIKEAELHHDMARYRGLDLADAAVVWGGLFCFQERKNPEDIQKLIDEINADRLKKHPQDPSAGSVFKNPEGHSSWKLVNDSGLRGTRIGGAMVSELHTNFIINTGDATSQDVRSLISLVQETVQKKFGVEMHTEVKIIGEF
jgi:UDP-N-acetylmuramate dehydrogenase